MSERTGPTRLILLNCGKFDYAEIDLDIPLHLVGPNNIGKTSLIALLQFLYIDEQTKMRFSRDMPTTRKYYFPDVSSFALFESLGPEGFMLTGVHGRGPVRAYEVERFACQGQYRRSDFLSHDNLILPWDQIKPNLASKGFVRLRPSDLRGALIGSALKKGAASTEVVNLSLVPLQKRGSYRRFCSVFLNLLRLSHLRQEELKRLLLELFEGDFIKRQINLQEDFSPQLEQLRRQKGDVQDLQRNEGAIRRILENVAKRDQLRSRLKSLCELINQLFHQFRTETNAQLDTYRSQLEQVNQDVTDLHARRETIATEHADKNKIKIELEYIQKELIGLQEEFRDYHPQLIDTQINELQREVRSLESTMESAAHESPEAIERFLNANLAEQKQLSEQLEHMEHALVSMLVQHIGSDETAQLSRLFNKGVLRLSTQGREAKATIHNIKALTRQLQLIISRLKGTIYQDDTVTLNLDTMEQFDPEDYLNPDRLREQITRLDKTIQNTQKALHAARDHKSHYDGLVKKKARLDELQETRAHFKFYQRKNQEYRDIDKQVRTVKKECEALDTQLSDLATRENRLKAKSEQLSHDDDGLSLELDKIDQKISELPPAQDTWPTDNEPSPKMELSDAIEHYRQSSGCHQQLAHRIDGELETIHSQTNCRYQRDTETETLEAFQAELENLKAKQDALQQSWISLTVQLKKDFKELNRDMEKLNAKVHSLNGQLAKVHISNLTNLKIVISSHTEYRRLFNDVERTEETPLFADSTKTDEAMRKISQILQDRPMISLEDMFDMHFEITTPQGGVKKYEHLDRIESNGTTITIKVLINLILLQRLLADDRVNIPFYLDECSSLDSENLRSIVQQARKLGFIAVLASPEAMDAADRLYYLSERQGRVTLNPKHCLVEIERTRSDQT